jgi:hypothetical protein
VKGELTDFGPSRGLDGMLPRLVIGGFLLTLVVGALVGLVADRWVIAKSTADTNLAAIVGPPCPSLTAEAAQRSLKAQGVALSYVFEFNGATFARVFGYADCSVASKDGIGPYDVCQFTSPAVLYVKTARREAYFVPGIGRKATVMTQDGAPSCVIAAPAWDD